MPTNLNFKYTNLVDYDDINDSLVNDVYFYIDNKIPQPGDRVFKNVYPYCKLLEVINNIFFKNNINEVSASYVVFIGVDNAMKELLHEGYKKAYLQQYQLSDSKIDIGSYLVEDIAHLICKIDNLDNRDFLYLPVQDVISSVRDHEVQGETISPYNDYLLLAVNIPINKAICRDALTFDIETFLAAVNKAAQSLETPNNPEYKTYVLHTVNKWTESGFWNFGFSLSAKKWKILTGLVLAMFAVYSTSNYSVPFVTWFAKAGKVLIS